MSHHEDETQARDAPKGIRGARGGKVSARAVVRLAQRVLHKDKWQSFDISQSRQCRRVDTRPSRGARHVDREPRAPNRQRRSAQQRRRRRKDQLKSWAGKGSRAQSARGTAPLWRL